MFWINMTFQTDVFCKFDITDWALLRFIFLVCWPISSHAPYWLLVFPSQVRTWISWSTSRCKNFSCRLPALRETKKLLSPYLLQKKWKLPEQGIEPGTSQSKVERSTNWAIEAFDTRLRILVDYVLQCCSWIKMGIFKVAVGKRRRIFLGAIFGSNFWEQFWEQFLGAIFGSNFWSNFWEQFLGAIFGSNFWEQFLGSNFGEHFLGPIEAIFGSNFWEQFLEAIFGSNFWEQFLGAIFGSNFREQFFGSNFGSNFSSNFREQFSGAIFGSNFHEQFWGAI